MVRRTLTALLLLAILIPLVYFGGAAFLVIVAAFFGTAAWEYSQMLRLKDHRTAPFVLIGAVLLILSARQFRPDLAPTILAACILVTMAVHLLRYEAGRDGAAVDLGMSLAGMTYLGWIGGYLLDLRALPDGLWWLSLVLVTVWIADTAAYFVGVRFGRHKMSPRLSPKKSWEGYAAGIVAGTAVATLLSMSLAEAGLLTVTPWKAAGLGLMLSSLTTLGDLGESLFKRYAEIKDSGTFLPGHGGAFDRIDSLIWAGALGYFWITLIP